MSPVSYSSVLKFRLTRGLIWVQIHMPVLAPIIDRFCHAFGFCLGH